MAFATARRRLIAALQDGNFVHDLRQDMEEKNLLAVGEVDEEFVIRLLNRARGDQYSQSPHHWAADVPVHCFAPEYEDRTWYVKAYFLDDAGGEAHFISVHM